MDIITILYIKSILYKSNPNLPFGILEIESEKDTEAKNTDFYKNLIQKIQPPVPILKNSPIESFPQVLIQEFLSLLYRP